MRIRMTLDQTMTVTPSLVGMMQVLQMSSVELSA